MNPIPYFLVWHIKEEKEKEKEKKLHITQRLREMKKRRLLHELLSELHHME